MQERDSHLPDSQLLLALDGESPAEEQEHLDACPLCRGRRRELEEGLADFSRAYQSTANGNIPPIEPARDALHARLSEPAFAQAFPRPWLAAAAVVVLAFASVLMPRWRGNTEGEFAPRSALTPGAARTLNREQVCTATENNHLRNVASGVAENIFREYGIRDPRPRSYEVDYLIPLDLGGTEDPRNLWPEPYASGVWNARVKDALEDRLRMLVCDGQIDLATAQQDLASDWIAAYKKYFMTQQPLISHAAFVKDQPWE